jgi:hypothetical protein
MFESYRELESSLHEVSKWVGRTARVLTASGGPAPETYLAVTRAIGGLHEIWSLHLEIERVLFPRMLCNNLVSSEFLERIHASDQAIEKQLEAILSAPWPRSAQAGLQSVQTGVTEILSRLLDQVKRECAVLLPAIVNMDRVLPAAVRVEPETSELVTT